MLTSTGGGLTVLIDCEFKPGHDWAAFACWYSLHKNLPDADPILCIRKSAPLDIFRWARAMLVPRHIHSDNLGGMSFSSPTIILKPCVVLAGDMDAEKLDRPLTSCDGEVMVCLPGEMDEAPWLCHQAKDDEPAAFVTFSGGLSNLNTDGWINMSDCPFSRAPRLLKAAASCNEVKVLKLWQQMSVLYSNIARGS